MRKLARLYDIQAVRQQHYIASCNIAGGVFVGYIDVQCMLQFSHPSVTLILNTDIIGHLSFQPSLCHSQLDFCERNSTRG